MCVNITRWRISWLTRQPEIPPTVLRYCYLRPKSADDGNVAVVVCAQPLFGALNELEQLFGAWGALQFGAAFAGLYPQ